MGGTALSILSPLTAARAEPIVVAEMAAEGLTRYPPSPDLLARLDRAGRCLRSPDLHGSVLLDAPAVAAWRAHPDFHIVK
ncbi:hypothetical protein BJY16_004447 [Actinoplanes octamycinicus]|uniref:Uncharacterized protein n=1 Tax=Actinoplanes octamycinicus TaxID=135948 RepID=A0A7W7M8J2_9ACTN|nr:hypothetical protein [Actinoplanes octamycinicus]MBB4740988.1 hypothetical protein [Actinoplanes octamycinicus]GIE55895.1 hypothetical protein Aoc01nite_12970 [Actinoplanes octamycinicus]